MSLKEKLGSSTLMSGRTERCQGDLRYTQWAEKSEAKVETQ